MRIGYIDNLRAILMMLGVVLHSAAVFSTQKYWLVSYQTSSVYLDWVNIAIHTFRMPLFFMIAGFFALMLLERYGIKRFLQNRVMRIGIPLVASALLLNTLQNYFMTLYYQDTGIQTNYFLTHAISHLWFLVNLICYCGALAFLYVCLKSKLKVSATLFGRIGFCCLIIIFPLTSIVVLAAGTLGAPIYAGLAIIGMPYIFLYYFSFFMFGVALYIVKPWVGYIESRLFTLALVTVGVGSIIFSLPDLQSAFYKSMHEYFRVLGMLLLCLFIWSAFARLVHKPRAWLSSLSNASYTMYLVHHLLIVLFAMGINILNIQASPFLLFGLMVLIVFCVSLLIHFLLVDKFSVLKWAFNGR